MHGQIRDGYREVLSPHLCCSTEFVTIPRSSNEQGITSTLKWALFEISSSGKRETYRFQANRTRKWALFEISSSGKRETYRFQANRTRKWALFENSSSGKRETYRFQANRTVEHQN